VSVIKNLVLTVLSGAFCAVAILLLFVGDPSDRGMLIGVLAFFGGCLIVGASLLAGDLVKKRAMKQGAETGDVRFRYASLFHLAFGAASLGMTFGAVIFALVSPWMWIVAAPALLLFGAGGLMFLYRALCDRRLVVAISADGIMDRRILARPVPWESIDAIGFPEIGPVQYLMLAVPDAHGFARPRGRFSSWMGRGQVTDGQILIAFQGLDGALTDALAAIGARKPDVVVLGDFTD
jgi:hypothetical protein